MLMMSRSESPPSSRRDMIARISEGSCEYMRAPTYRAVSVYTNENSVCSVGGAPGFGLRCVKSEAKAARPQSSSSSRPSTSMPSPGSSFMAPRVLLTHEARVRRHGVQVRTVSPCADACEADCGVGAVAGAAVATGGPPNRSSAATSAATRSGSVICTGPRRLRPSRAGKSEDRTSGTLCVPGRYDHHPTDTTLKTGETFIRKPLPPCRFAVR